MGVFRFKKDDISRHIIYELKSLRKLDKALDYMFDMMPKIGNSLTLTSLEDVDLNEVQMNKGKNYDWSLVVYENVNLLIRRYQNHLTVYTRTNKEERYKSETACFTFYTDTKDLNGEETELLYDNPFINLNKCIKEIITTLQENNAVYLEYLKSCPKNVEMNIVFWEEMIYSYDKLIFCLEEIDHFHLKLFSETTMLEKLPELKERIGEEITNSVRTTYTIKEVKTEVKSDSYHSVGLSLEDKNGKDKFEDVYSLTRWFYDAIYPEEKKEK